MREITGFRGAEVLRRQEGDEVTFVTLTRFDSLDAVRAFAGADYEVPVIEPEAQALLSRYDERAQHFDSASFSLSGEQLDAVDGVVVIERGRARLGAASRGVSARGRLGFGQRYAARTRLPL